MTDLTNLISAAVAAKMTPEFIEKEVDARVEALVKDSINSALRTYSETGKLIEKAVQDALRVDRLDLPSYGSLVTAMLHKQIEACVAPVIAGRLTEDMAELLHLAPQAVKLSAIADAMRDRYSEYHPEAYGKQITVIVDAADRGYVWLYLDEDQHVERMDKYKAKFHVGVDSEGKIFSLSVNGHNLTSSTHFGRGYGLDQKLRSYYACGTVLEIDQDAVVISIGDY